MRRRRIGLLLATCGLALAVAGCSSTSVRFEPGPVITEVDDRRDIERPAETEFYRYEHHLENFFARRARLALDPVPPHPALDVNRLGEVPSSSWYVDRGTLSPEDVEAGRGKGLDSPEAHFPWTITGGKVGGRNPGFMVRDANGDRYLLKFDKRGEPTVTTAAGAVANRLFWALGLHVPDDRVVFFEREQLQLGGGAAEDGITPEGVDRVLEDVATRHPDGRWRALVSRFLPGRPVGGFSYTSTREDDPNDVIPHQRRRSLRGMRVFAAWLNHVDTKIDNTLDLYTERDGRRFLEHYLVDFDGCLGGYWAARHERRIGWAYDFDLGQLLTAIPALGLDHRPYEDLKEPAHPSIGLFEAEVYDPAAWTSNYVNDQILSATPADLYWAGTVMARLDRAHIAAAVRAARFADPEATRLLTGILHRRWEKTTAWALLQVTPVEELRPRPRQNGSLQIAAVDPLARLGLGTGLRFDARLLDDRGRLVRELLVGSADPAVMLRTEDLEGQDYRIVEWVARDGAGRSLPPTRAHYGRTAGGWQLWGILRDGQ